MSFLLDLNQTLIIPHRAKNNTNNLLWSFTGYLDRLKHWTIVLNGGDRWAIENPPVGCDPLPEHITEFESHNSCFSTSFSECKKQQTIALKEHGFTDKIMDEIQPDIEISEW